MVGVCEGECMGCSLVDEPLNLMTCYSYMNPLKGGSLWPSLQLKGHEGKNLFFSFLSFVSLLL